SFVFLHGSQKLNDAAGFLFRQHEWGFVALVGSLGFPASAFFAVCGRSGVSVAALLVACRRIAAAAVTTTMVVAVYASQRTGTLIGDMLACTRSRLQRCC